MADCVFCCITAGESEAHVVLDVGEGPERVVAFLDRTPLFPGHTLAGVPQLKAVSGHTLTRMCWSRGCGVL